ncbi:hypothetical protein ASG29_04145 [Sphingomonas sp. Leaf412]|nr:hypothetical protein ASG29_04145 [Sphingomonas sp. Leaf412]
MALALSILTYHSFDVVRGPEAATGAAWLLIESLLPMFFALSGFLITGSGQRLSLGSFLLHRGLRIFPALFVEVLFSALILGALVTSLTPSQYLASPGTWRYLLNITGNIQYVLPGVFVGHPHSGMVNASLWTIPWELACYAFISVAIVTAVIRRPAAMVIVSLGAVLLPLIVYLALPYIPGGSAMAGSGGYGRASGLVGGVVARMTRVLLSWEFRVVPFFMAGCVCYILREAIPYSARLAALIAIALVAACLFLPARWDTPILNAVLCPALVYLTVFIGLTPLPRLPVFDRGDYSYGIYLYGYPIQQTLYAVGIAREGWLWHAMVGAVLACAFAAFSWHVIERPILSRRKSIARLILSDWRD